MNSAEEDLESEELIAAEGSVGQLVELEASLLSHAAPIRDESLPDSSPQLARVRDRLWQKLTTQRFEARMHASHRNIRSASPEF